MVTETQKKYKVDLNKIYEKSVEEAFGENRIKVNEEGLSVKALDEKKAKVAIETAAKMFVHEVYVNMMDSGKRITSDDRRKVEALGQEAIAQGEEWLEYLSQYCE